jgi:hypothetical protein
MKKRAINVGTHSLYLTKDELNIVIKALDKARDEMCNTMFGEDMPDVVEYNDLEYYIEATLKSVIRAEQAYKKTKHWVCQCGNHEDAVEDNLAVGFQDWSGCLVCKDCNRSMKKEEIDD